MGRVGVVPSLFPLWKRRLPSRGDGFGSNVESLGSGIPGVRGGKGEGGGNFWGGKPQNPGRILGNRGGAGARGGFSRALPAPAGNNKGPRKMELGWAGHGRREEETPGSPKSGAFRPKTPRFGRAFNPCPAAWGLYSFLAIHPQHDSLVFHQFFFLINF